MNQIPSSECQHEALFSGALTAFTFESGEIREKIGNGLYHVGNNKNLTAKVAEDSQRPQNTQENDFLMGFGHSQGASLFIFVNFLG
ncbi:MAG: hypothetical protein PHX83_17640 [Acidobacteriia bacterium]|nr:hypothetical protein [Terriglobia bacterium]